MRMKIEDKVFLSKVEKEVVSNSREKYEDLLIDFIKQTVAKYFEQPSDVYMMKSKKQSIVKVKQVCMYLILKNSKSTLDKIGKSFGKDHSTVHHANKVITNYLEWDKDLVKEIADLQNVIYLKAKGIVHNLDLEKDFYFVDLNSFTSLKTDKGKAILLSGYTEDEQKKIKKKLKLLVDGKKHNNTGMYILEKNEKTIN